MKDNLSKLTEKGKNPENYLSNKEIKDLLKLSSQMHHIKAKEFRPTKVSNKFKLFKAIIMISIIGLIIIAITQFGFKKDSNTPAQMKIISRYNEQSVMATDTLQATLDTISQKVGDRTDSLKGISKDTTLLNTSGSQLIVGNGDAQQLNDNSSPIQSEVDNKSKIKQDLPDPFEIDKLNFEPVLISNDVLDCIGIDSIVRSFDKLPKIGIWGTDIFDHEEEDYILAYVGVYNRYEWRDYLNNLPEYIEFSDSYEIFLDEILQYCIPFQSETKGKNGDFQIYWIFPSDKLLDCLPDNISDPMRIELIRSFNPNWSERLDISPPRIEDNEVVDNVKVDQNEETVPCNYLPNFCEGMSGLDNMIVFPNPVSDQVNIDITISKEMSIQFRIIDLTGRVFNDDLGIKQYSEAGRYVEKLDLSVLKPGFYLIVLTDKYGARLTKRIIKK